MKADIGLGPVISVRGLPATIWKLRRIGLMCRVYHWVADESPQLVDRVYLPKLEFWPREARG